MTNQKTWIKELWNKGVLEFKTNVFMNKIFHLFTPTYFPIKDIADQKIRKQGLSTYHAGIIYIINKLYIYTKMPYKGTF